jgi:hypothetical protein
MSSANRTSRHDLPVPESPIRRISGVRKKRNLKEHHWSEKKAIQIWRGHDRRKGKNTPPRKLTLFWNGKASDLELGLYEIVTS